MKIKIEFSITKNMVKATIREMIKDEIFPLSKESIIKRVKKHLLENGTQFIDISEYQDIEQSKIDSVFSEFWIDA